jgi:hypothetical protein
MAARVVPRIAARVALMVAVGTGVVDNDGATGGTGGTGAIGVLGVTTGVLPAVLEEPPGGRELMITFVDEVDGVGVGEWVAVVAVEVAVTVDVAVAVEVPDPVDVAVEDEVAENVELVRV